MKIDAEVAVRKLRKFSRDPNRFLYDFFRKRVPEEHMPAATGGSLVFDTTDYDVEDAVAVIANPTVVAQLKQLKQGSGRRPAKIGMFW